MHRTRRRVAAVSALLATILLAGCTGSSKSDSSSAGSVDNASAANAKSEPAAAAAGVPLSAQKPATATTLLPQRDIVRTATLAVEVPDVDQAAAAVTRLVVRTGRVDTDNRSGDGAAGPSRHAELVLRVQPGALDQVIASVVGLGKQRSRTVEATDVTAAQVDINARVGALRTSVARLDGFLKVSGSVTQLVALETQLSNREAQLESLVAQQRALGDQIALATLTVDLTEPGAAASRHSGPAGFGAAIGGGWRAFTAGLRYALAGLGYGLPFAVPLAVLLYLRLRWRRRPSPTIESAANAQ